MLPAYERLDPPDPMRQEIRLRLVVNAELAHFQRIAEIRCDRESVVVVRAVGGRIVDLDAARAFPLRGDQRRCRMAEQRFEIGSVAGIEGDADVDVHGHAHAVDLERRPECAADAPRDPLGAFDIRRLADDAELVFSEPCDHGVVR